MHERTRFHHKTVFLYSFSRHLGSNKLAVPSESLMTDRISFCNTHGPNRSHIRGDSGPLEPMKVGDEHCTQK